MSAANLIGFVGQTGSLTLELSLTIAVRVVDARKCWDRLDFLIAPIHGKGARWVAADRVTLDSDVARGQRQEVAL